MIMRGSKLRRSCHDYGPNVLCNERQKLSLQNFSGFTPLTVQQAILRSNGYWPIEILEISIWPSTLEYRLKRAETNAMRLNVGRHEHVGINRYDSSTWRRLQIC